MVSGNDDALTAEEVLENLLEEIEQAMKSGKTPIACKALTEIKDELDYCKLLEQVQELKDRYDSLCSHC